MKILIYILLCIVFFSCSGKPKVELVKKEKGIKSTSVTQLPTVSARELSTLFYPDYVETQVKVQGKKPEVIKEITPNLNYSIAAQWTVKGVRWIKLRNNDDKKEIIFEESSPPEGISVIKKDLMYYIIKIGNQEIKAPR